MNKDYTSSIDSKSVVETVNVPNQKEVTGRAKGAMARAEKLSPERRSEIARNAALSKRPLEAIKKGNFYEKLGVDAECYVLNDGSKTAVITQSGMGAILGLGEGGSRLPRFVSTAKMSSYIGAELHNKIQNPLVFSLLKINPKSKSTKRFSADNNGVTGPLAVGSTANGYNATVLIELCQAILQANMNGVALVPAVVKQASIIVNSSAKLGIQGLIYAITGFNQTHADTILAYQRFVEEEAKKYEKEFPQELYLEWARLYGIPTLERGRNWKHRHLTLNDIYFPLAKSNGVLLQMLREAKNNNGDGNAKLFQFLNEIGARALRMHLGRVLEMTQSSRDKDEYEAKIRARFGVITDF